MFAAPNESIEVVECSEDKKQEILDQWESEGADKSVLLSLQEDMFSNNSTWYVVNCEGKPKAVFDIRKVPHCSPDYHKSMRIHFAPPHHIGAVLDNGTDFAEVEAVIDLTSTILARAFGVMIEEAKNTHSRLCKIYSDHPLVFSIYRSFVQILTTEYPDKYRGKYYKNNWLEISSR